MVLPLKSLSDLMAYLGLFRPTETSFKDYQMEHGNKAKDVQETSESVLMAQFGISVVQSRVMAMDLSGNTENLTTIGLRLLEEQTEFPS